MDAFTPEEEPGESGAFLDFSYSNDQLSGMGQNNISIAYDVIGNPLQYIGAQGYSGSLLNPEATPVAADLQWQGRQLVGATANDFGTPMFGDVQYSYDADGLRSSKTMSMNGTALRYDYLWNGDQLLGYNIVFNGMNLIMRILYSDTGEALGYSYYSPEDGSGDTLWYIKNTFGDIQGLYSETYQRVEVLYTYDAWGNPTMQQAFETQGFDGLRILIYLITNQLTYRGYYYDFETGFYYLQSRYYAPSWCRFLNRDEHFDTGTGVLGTNMYIYCDNNPVMLVDPTGEGGNVFTNTNYTDYKVYFNVTSKDNVDIAMNSKHNSKGTKKTLPKGGKAKVVGVKGSKYCVEYGKDSKGKIQKWFVEKSQVKPARTISDGIYFIKNVWTQLYMDNDDGKIKDKNPVIQWHFNGGNPQKWIVRYEESSGYYTIALDCARSKVLDARSAADANKNDVEVYINGNNNTTQQKWLIISWGSSYRIISKESAMKNSPKGLEIGKTNKDPEDPVQLWTMGGHDKQKWNFEAATVLGGAEGYREVKYKNANGVINKYGGKTSKEINCLGYALNINAWLFPSKSFTTTIGVSGAFPEVKSIVEDYGRGCRLLSGKDDLIRPYEYKIAMRAQHGSYSYLGQSRSTDDIHFMMQLKDGTWAEKGGSSNSVKRTEKNPSTMTWYIPWKINSSTGEASPKVVCYTYENNKTLYFAVTK